jgi:hypothetical protein
MAGHLVKRTHRHRYFPRFSPFAFADPSLVVVVAAATATCAFLLVYVLALVLPTFAPSSLHFVYSLFLVPRFVSSSSFAPFSHFILGTIYVGFALYASYSPKPTHLLD